MSSSDPVRRAHGLDRGGHVGVARNGVAQHGHQLEGVVLHPVAADVEVQAAEKLAVRSRGQEKRLADRDHHGQRIVRVSGEDHVDACHPARELAVDVEAIVRQQHDQLSPFAARLVDLGLDVFLADAEAPVRDHPARIGDGRVGERLADHRDLDATALIVGRALEHRVLELGVAHVLRQEWVAEAADELLDALGAVGELEMPGQRIGLQHGHQVDHVLAAGLQCRPRALPGIAAVQQQHALRPLGANGCDQSGDPVESTDPAIGAGQRAEVLAGEHVGVEAPRGDAEALQEGLAGDVRRLAHGIADAQIY